MRHSDGPEARYLDDREYSEENTPDYDYEHLDWDEEYTKHREEFQ